MSIKKGNIEKKRLHPRNKNYERYDLKAMAIAAPELKEFVQQNKKGGESIDFSNPDAVRILNKAILNYYYGIKYWEFPKESLCPPIPGRAEYIHLIADLLSENNNDKIPLGKKTTCLDIGVGASCIYPIIGITEYKWDFIGSEIDRESIQSAEKIVNLNPMLNGKVKIKKQTNAKFIFKGIINKEHQIDISICNPPFHASKEEALKGTKRKVRNLTGQKTNKPKLNFSGNLNELIYEGGEYQFISKMIEESKEFAKNVFWFSTLVSKESTLKKVKRVLQKNNPSEIRVINIEIGNKKSRILAWTYFNLKERKIWRNTKWSV